MSKAKTDGIDSQAYLKSCLAILPTRTIKLEPLCSRPTGKTHLGVKTLFVPATIGAIDGLDTQVLVDTGANITLISMETYQKIPEKPKIKKTEDMPLASIGGNFKAQGYITVPIFFTTKKGVIEMELDLYIIIGMKWPVILSNDFQEQYQISVLRSDQGTKVSFGGDHEQYMEASSTITVPEELRNLIAAIQEKPKNKLPFSTAPRDNLIRIPHRITIQPRMTEPIPFILYWPENIQEYFLEPETKVDPDGNRLYIPDTFITKETQLIYITNAGQSPFTLPAGSVIGHARDPYDFLDKEVIKEHMGMVNVIQSIYRPQPEIVITDPRQEGEDLENGPKTMIIPPDPTAKEDLLKTVNINPDLPQEQQDKLKRIIQENHQAFGLDGRLGKPKQELQLQLKPNTKPIALPERRQSPEKQKAIDEQIQKWIEQDVIAPSTAPWNAPLVVVWKNGKPRICVDFRKLNEATIPNKFPLPRMEDIRNRIAKAKYKSIMDALAGFNQILVKTEDQDILSFSANSQHWKFKRMPFGIINGPAEFQGHMMDMFGQFIRNWMDIYIDDMAVYDDDFDQHCQHLETVFKILIQNDFTLSPKKCFFGYTSLVILGLKISRYGLSTQKEKIEAIDQVPTPISIKSLQRFIGMCVYYMQLIPYFAWIAKPLFSLIANDPENRSFKEKWGKEQQTAFETLKVLLKSTPVMAYPMEGLGYRLYTDASLLGISGILQQVQPIKIEALKGTKIYEKLKKKWETKEEIPRLFKALPAQFDSQERPQEWAQKFEDTIVWIERVIAYYSRTLRPAESHISATEREILALNDSLEKFQPLIEGEEVKHQTDCGAIIYTKTFNNMNIRLRKWGLKFAAYPKLQHFHRSGKRNYNADFLSRLDEFIPNFTNIEEDPGISIEIGKDDQITPREWRAITYGQEINNISLQIKPEIKQKLLTAYDTDPFIQKIKKDLEQNKSENRKSPFGYNEFGNLVIAEQGKHTRLVIPKDEVVKVLQMHNELSEGAHQGIQKTYAMLRQKYFWPSMKKDIEEYISTCPVCQKIKPKTHAPYGLGQPIPIPEQPWERVTMDWIPDLPITNTGNNCIYTMVDPLTKAIELEAIKTSFNEQQTAEVFNKKIITQKGFPLKILSDRAAVWANKFWEEVCKYFGSARNLTTAHHPQTDGQSEAANKIIEIALRAFCNEHPEDWDTKLQEFAFVYNTTPSTVTGYTPFYLNHGYEARKPEDFLNPRTPENPIITEKDSTKIFLENIEVARLHARDAMLLAQHVYTTAYNKGRLDVTFKEGDSILVNPYTLKLSGKWMRPGNKLLQRYEGPFKIREVLSPTVYRVQLPDSWQIHPVINIHHLEKYKRSPEKFGPRPDFPIETRAGKTEEWDVIEILKERYHPIRKGVYQRQFQAKWLYPDGHHEATDEWVPAKNFTAPDVIASWERRLKAEPQLKGKRG